MIGQIISQYKILAKLGQGGMGVVYKAHDTRLDRIVALKFLPPHLVGQEAEQARFLQEARAASALNHPNVCTIYDIKEEGGEQFIVMEFVDGVTIRGKLPVPNLQDAISYAIQIGDALYEAHCRGIVHRDIKCENIMVNSKNQIKVMDFGLAKLKGSLKLTRTSSTVGTLAYMAPEQIQGGEIDARSDIFSFGVVLFEMLASRMPFKGEHEAALMYSILNEEPESVLKSRPDLPADIDRIIRRALEKDPADRYQHIDDMVSELRRVQKQSTKITRPLPKVTDIHAMAAVPARPQETITIPTAPAPDPQPQKRPQHFLIGAGVLAFLVIIAAAYYFFFSRTGTIDSIAVLPFTNVGADPNTEYLSDGITESLINSLSQISTLTVMSRSSVFHFKGKDADPQIAGKELGVKAVLTGRVSQRGNDLIVSTELVNVANNSHIWGDQYNKKLADVLAIQEEISKEISSRLSLKLGGEDEKKLAKHATENTEAYQLYLKGRFHWNKRKADDFQKAIDYYNQAIAQDPNYALAYAGLASAYVLLPEYASVPPAEAVPKAEAAARKALELDPSLAEPHAVLGLAKYAFAWDWAGAENELRQAIALNPNYPTAHHWYCICLRQQGKLDQSMAEIKKAQELDPLSPVIGINVSELLMLAKRYDEAETQAKKVLEIDPNFPGAYGDLGTLYYRMGRYEESITALLKVRQIVGPGNLFGMGSLGFVYGKAGKKEEARMILDRLLIASGQGSWQSGQIAMLYLGLGEKSKALDWLERSYNEKNILLGNLKVAPVFDDLRSEPRFVALERKIGLAQ